MAPEPAPPPGPNPFVIETFTYLGLCLLIIGLRTYCRARRGSLGPEDYLMLASIVPLVAEVSIAYTVGSVFHGLTNSNMTTEEREALSPDSVEFQMRVGGSKAIIGGWSSYTTLIWMIKASMCAFYLRLTDRLEGYKIRIYIGFGSIVVSYIVCMSSILFSCQPFHRAWQINPYPGNLCEPAVNKLIIYSSMFLNFLTDMHLFLIPIPMFWAANLPKAKKIGLIALFSGGIVIMVFGFLRGVAILKSDATGPKEGASWACRESFVAITTTNLPMTWSWMRERLRPVLGTFVLHSKSQGAKHDPRSGSKPDSMALEDADVHRWSASTTKAIISSTPRVFRKGPFSVNWKGGSDEESVPDKNDVGGIMKHVELRVSSSTA